MGHKTSALQCFADAVCMGHRGSAGPEGRRLHHLSGQQLSEEPVPAGPGAPISAATAEPANSARHQAAHLWVVGHRAPHQLLRRLAHGVRTLLPVPWSVDSLNVAADVQGLNQRMRMSRWAWCLPCGTGSVVPYFYVIYFAVLLCALPSAAPHDLVAQELRALLCAHVLLSVACSAPG